MIPVIGTTCGLLAAAAFTGGIRPAVVLPEAGDAGLSIAEDSAPADDRNSALAGAGPLAMPSIGVVAPGFDERYAALVAASHSAPAPATEDVDALVQQYLPAYEPVGPTSSDPVPLAPAPPPTLRPTEPPTTPPPTTPPPTTPPPTTPPPTTPPPTTPPPTGGPTDEEPPVEPPVDPPVEPPVEPPVDPPVEPPVDLPGEEPTGEVPTDVELGVGETFDVVDTTTSAVLYSVTVDGVTADLACSAAGALPAQNGHFVGLALRITTGAAPADGEQPVVSPADFELVGAEDTVVDTDGAAACLDDAAEFPSTALEPDQAAAGTVVLDLPADTGTVAFRPESRLTSLLWRF